jgi:hypothetical protein
MLLGAAVPLNALELIVMLMVYSVCLSYDASQLLCLLYLCVVIVVVAPVVILLAETVGWIPSGGSGTQLAVGICRALTRIQTASCYLCEQLAACRIHWIHGRR